MPSLSIRLPLFSYSPIDYCHQPFNTLKTFVSTTATCVFVYIYDNLVINSISFGCLLGASIARRTISNMITTSLILLVFLTFWDSITLSQAQCNPQDLTCDNCTLWKSNNFVTNVGATTYCYPGELTDFYESSGANDCCCQSEADCIIDRTFKFGSTIRVTGNCEYYFFVFCLYPPNSSLICSTLTNITDIIHIFYVQWLAYQRR